MKPARPQRGFTLLELSISLMVIALLTGMAVSSGVGVLSASRLVATQKRMKAIDNALMQFRTANDRLPCPADLTIAVGAANFGVEGATPGTCTGGTPSANHSAAGITNTSATAAEGAVPVVTLGLPNDDMVDGWGNRFRYAVDIRMTALGAFPGSSLCTAIGAITVNDASGVARTTGAIYALISHGPNGHGAYTAGGVTTTSGSKSADELTNCHCTSAGVYNSAYAPLYVQKLPQYDSGQTGNPLYYFDDLVSYKERWQMRTDWDAVSCSTGSKYIWVTDGDTSRIQAFNTSGTYQTKFGTTGTADGDIEVPGSIAQDASGNLWVSDYSDNRVEKFNSGGTYLMAIGAGYNGVGGTKDSSGTGSGRFNYPYVAKVDASGNIWVADYNNNRVQEFNSSGTFLLAVGSGYQGIGGTIGASGTTAGKFTGPMGIAFDSSSNVWVVDNDNNRVQEFSSSGTYIGQLGCTGTSACANSQSGNGKFYRPGAVTIDSGGNIWVTDGNNNRVEEFTSGGSYSMGIGAGYNGVTGSVGSSGSGNGQFNNPSDVAIDTSGNVWVVDENNNRVQEFSSSGTFLMGIGAGYNGVSGSIGTSGSGNGQFEQPSGILITSR